MMMADPKEKSAKVHYQLKRWKERLLDLSKSNPLLRLNQSRVSRLKVVSPPAINIFAQLVKEKPIVLPHVYRTNGQLAFEGFSSDQKSQLVLEKGDIEFDEEIEKIHRKLRRIYDTARTSIQERGVITLHLSFGVLNWTDEQYGDSSSPLILVPCEIESKGPKFPMELKKADQEIQLNQALSLVLQKKFLFQFEELNEETLLNKGGLTDWWNALQKQIKPKKLDWTIESEVWLTNFSFESLALVQDLNTLSEVAIKNPIVAAMAKVPNRVESRIDISEHDLDKLNTPEIVPLPVLPADSSQLKSLTLARTGNNLVIHGPPGTGKSQTICNLIADALGNQKKVLFVSAKIAALEVVHRRLVQLGLDQFCLEAHSTKAGKGTIMEELRRTLISAEQQLNDLDLDYSLKDFEKIRKELNEYVEHLHTKDPNMELSVYEAIGRIEKLNEVHYTHSPIPWNDLSVVRKSDVVNVFDKLELISHYSDIYYHSDKHPWRGLRLLKNKNVTRSMIVDNLTILFGGVKGLISSLQKLEPLIGDVQYYTIRKTQRIIGLINELLNLGDPVPKWFQYRSEQLLDLKNSIQQAEQITHLISKNISEHRKRWKITPEELVLLLEPVEKKYSNKYRTLRPDYWFWRLKINRALKKDVSLNFEDILHSWKTAKGITKARSWYQKNRDLLISGLGKPIQFQTSWLAEVQTHLQSMAEYKRYLESIGVEHSSSPLQISPDLKINVQNITTILNDKKFLDSLESFSKLWPDGFLENLKAEDASLNSLVSHCDNLMHSINSVEEWLAFQRAKDLCEELELLNFIENLEDGLLPHVVKVFEKKLLIEWVSTIITKSDHLAVFKGERRDYKINQFQKLDEELEKAWLSHVKYNASIPALKIAAARDDLGNSSEVAILRRELLKQRRYKPLRRLFSEIPNVLTALKPCMLMSPISVSTFFMPDKYHFDIVIFDEASQLLTPEAIPAILRAKQVIVAGDTKQLPPTSFFMGSSLFDMEVDGYDEDDEDYLESLLDDCIAIYPTFDQSYLRWHYRSRDERLIAFSNHYFYNEKPLITFPSVFIDEYSEDQGVRYVHVNDGLWDRGNSRTNISEAKKVIDVFREQLVRHPERSIGIVTMNVSQRELIEELLDNLLIEEPSFAKKIAEHTQEPLFVKALENVQGDERDTILISIGYAKTIDGSFSYNFGPINKEGGWRRLNVLVTRARFQTILVTSLRSTDLAGINPNNLGAIALRNFIEYAERGCKLSSNNPVITRGETNDFEDSVADEIRKRGYIVDQQVGVGRFRIDLAVRDPRNPNLYLLGIECDGATYHSSPTARDRDIIREKILNDLGWSIHRVWSTDWFRNKLQTINRIIDTIQKCMTNPRIEGQIAPPINNRTIPIEKPETKNNKRIKSQGKYTPGQTYRKFSAKGKREFLLSESDESTIREQIYLMIKTEGPIHMELLKRRLIEVNSVGRIGHKISNRIEETVDDLVNRKSIYKDPQNFLKLTNQSIKSFRNPLDFIRPIEWVPDEEISLAICYIVEDQVSFLYDELPKAIAKLFGWERAPNTLPERLDKIVKDLLHKKILVQKGNKLMLLM